MRRLSALALVLTFIAGCRTTPQPFGAVATGGSLSCRDVQVFPTTTLGAPIVIPSNGVSCDGGSLVAIDPNSGEVNLVILAQSLTRGPDCNMTFQVGSSTYIINVQQNFCEFEAGQLSATVIFGNATVITEQGSFSGATPGTVHVALN